MFDADGTLKIFGEQPSLRVLFAGDLCPINRLEGMLAGGDLDGAFGSTRPLFERADLTVVNLEAPLCAAEDPIDKLGPNFRADPRIARSLAEAPVHVACLANNHMMDQGAEGLSETLKALDDAGIKHLGACMDQADAALPLRIEAGGIRLALLNFATVEGALPRTGPGAARIGHLAVRRAVAKAAESSDAVIPILHTGKEQVLFPSPGMREFCRELIDAGAIAVVCHHPHVPQGIELHNGRPIVYSLGNFLFDWSETEPETDTAFLLELGLSGAGVSELAVHAITKTEKGGADLMRGRQRSDYLAFIEEISAPLAQDDVFTALWREQCQMLLESWHKPRLARGSMLASEDAGERRRAQLTFLNLLENDEHGEALRESLLALATGRNRPDPEARQMLEGLMGRLKGFAGIETGTEG